MGVTKDVVFVVTKLEELSNVPIRDGTSGSFATPFDATEVGVGFVDELH